MAVGQRNSDRRIGNSARTAKQLESFLDVSKRPEKRSENLKHVSPKKKRCTIKKIKNNRCLDLYEGGDSDKEMTFDFERKSHQMFKKFLDGAKKGTQEVDPPKFTNIQSFAVTKPLQLRPSKSADMPMYGDEPIHLPRKKAKKVSTKRRADKSAPKTKGAKDELTAEEPNKRNIGKQSSAETPMVDKVDKPPKTENSPKVEPVKVSREEKRTVTKTVTTPAVEAKVQTSQPSTAAVKRRDEEEMRYFDEIQQAQIMAAQMAQASNYEVQQAQMMAAQMAQASNYEVQQAQVAIHQAHLANQQQEAYIRAQAQMLARLSNECQAYKQAIVNQQQMQQKRQYRQPMTMASLPRDKPNTSRPFWEQSDNPAATTGTFILFVFLALISLWLFAMERKEPKVDDLQSYSSWNEQVSYQASPVETDERAWASETETA